MKVTDPTSRLRTYADRQWQTERELLNGASAHKRAIEGLQIRAEQIWKEIKIEEACEKPDMARLERLREINANIKSTLLKCR